MEAVQQLEAKTSLLDVNQLDTIETRLGTLIYRMDSIAQKKAAAEQDSEQEQKVIYHMNIKINITIMYILHKINVFCVNLSHRSQRCMKS